MFPYYVLDTETTGFSPKKDEMIEVAAIKVVDGRIADSFETFINPGRHIPKRITDLTGISDSDVCDAPDCDTVAVELDRFLSEPYPVVGHNIAFDLRFIQAAFERVGLDYDFEQMDTCKLARQAFPYFLDYKLNTLIEGLNLANHEQMHRAMDDVIVTNNLFILCLNQLERRRQREKWSAGRKDNKKVISKNLSPTVQLIDTTNPLYGKIFVFAGELSISREAAAQIVVNCGGIVRSVVSGRTNFLIFGNQADLYDDGETMEKTRKAEDVNAKGASVQLLDELAFFRMIPISAIPDADGIAIF